MQSDKLFDNKSILVVDDDAESRKIILETLLMDAPELDVWMVPSGEEAIKVLENKTPNIIILDWEMPEMNGIELLGRLSLHPIWKNIPVLMHTGAMILPEHLKLAINEGAVDFLRKPANPIELTARLRAILRQKKLEKERIEVELELLNVKNGFLKKELELLRNDLEGNLLILAQKNKNFQQIKELCTLQKGKENYPFILKKIKSLVDNFLNDEDYWSNFIAQFDKTDLNFSLKLLGKHPELSSKEVRTCALIRLGLDNKAIAHLLNISGEGMKKKRYRIRKKINLDYANNLEHYIFSL